MARIAAIQAAKRTSELIPLCHPLALTRVSVEFALDAADSCVAIEVTAETIGRTGVEMEALTAAAVGLLTIYDMCKAADRGMRVDRCGCWKNTAASPATGPPGHRPRPTRDRSRADAGTGSAARRARPAFQTFLIY